MMASRGMGDISPSKMPKGAKKARRDNTDFTQYKEGGKVKSKVNEAGNYTKPELRKRIFNSVKAAQLLVLVQGSGRHVKHKSWLNGIKPQVVAINDLVKKVQSVD